MTSPVVTRSLATLGADIRAARLRRRIALQDFAERVGVSPRTIARLEKGDEGVGIGTLAMACLVLGELDRLARLLDPASDDTGLMMEREALPKRIARRRVPKARPAASGPNRNAEADDEGENGVGF